MAGPKAPRRATVLALAGEGGGAAAAKAGESAEGRTRRRSGRGASVLPSLLSSNLCGSTFGSCSWRSETGKAVLGRLRPGPLRGEERCGEGLVLCPPGGLSRPWPGLTGSAVSALGAQPPPESFGGAARPSRAPPAPSEDSGGAQPPAPPDVPPAGFSGAWKLQQNRREGSSASATAAQKGLPACIPLRRGRRAGRGAGAASGQTLSALQEMRPRLRGSCVARTLTSRTLVLRGALPASLLAPMGEAGRSPPQPQLSCPGRLSRHLQRGGSWWGDPEAQFLSAFEKGGGRNDSLTACPFVFSAPKTVRLLAPPKPSTQEEHFAASTGHTNWLQLCLQKSETPTQADINGFSALHLAALNGRLDCIKMLIERYHVDVNLVSTTGWRPVHLVMSKESEDRALECLQYLIKKGADVNVQNQKGVTPLHKAASEGRKDCVKALVEAGADVHAKDNEGQEPLDLCKMWGHRPCAKYLASALWKRDKADFAQEVRRLNQLKEELEIREQEFLKREQGELDFANSIAFEQWLERKCLPLPSDRILGFVKKRPRSVSVRKPAGKGVSRMAFPVSRAFADQLRPIQMDKDLLRPSWNVSTNVCSAPVTSILRPSTIRMGIEPEKPLEHDFTSFLLLSRDTFGNPELYVSSWGKVSTLPNLPFEVIQKNIYPHTQITRLESAQDFKPRHIFDVASKRHPSPEHWWTDQMALSLRETLDPAYIGTLKAHLATYTDPRVVFPQLEPSYTSGRESSMQSQQLPELNDSLHVARPC